MDKKKDAKKAKKKELNLLDRFALKGCVPYIVEFHFPNGFVMKVRP